MILKKTYCFKIKWLLILRYTLRILNDINFSRLNRQFYSLKIRKN